jgi:Grx4 family monothiol glutaredoxin
MPLTTPQDSAEAEALLAGSCIANFFAAWAEPCAHLNAVFAELSREQPQLAFVQVDADTFPELCERYQLETVPAFLFLQGGVLTSSVLGADVQALINKVKQHSVAAAIASDTPLAASAAKPPLDERLHALTHKAPVVLFMKGEPAKPRCGFSRKAVEMLQGAAVPFETFDILGDEEVRQGLKTFSNWPTYPQLYAKGKLLGGLDIMRELSEEGELKAELGIE